MRIETHRNSTENVQSDNNRSTLVRVGGSPFLLLPVAARVGLPQRSVIRGVFVDLPSLTSWVSSHHLALDDPTFLSFKKPGHPQHHLEGTYNWCCQALVASKGKNKQRKSPLGIRTTNAALQKGGQRQGFCGRESAKQEA